jgi:regulator of sigma E protease
VRYAFAIVALGVLVALHELGHLLAARAFHIRILRYSLGFGPPILTFKRGETAYTLGALPLGGYVQIHGMSPHEEGVTDGDPRLFLSQRPWKRILVLVSGSVLNYVLALGLLCALYLGGTHVPVPMTVGAVDPGSEAARGQLRPGDRIAAINGVPLERWTDLVDVVSDHPGQWLSFSIARAGELRDIPLQPRADEDGAGRIGVAQQYVYREQPFGEALWSAFQHTNGLLTDGLHALVRLARGRKGVELSTPVGIVKQASDAAQAGADAFIRILAAISVALAVFNLLPLPSLDGGRVLFAAAEGISRRRVSPELENVLHAVGFLVILAALALYAARDIRRLLPASHAELAPASSDGGH